MPIVQNVASRDIIGQAINEVLLDQKTVDVACADANKSLGELLAKEGSTCHYLSEHRCAS